MNDQHPTTATPEQTAPTVPVPQIHTPSPPQAPQTLVTPKVTSLRDSADIGAAREAARKKRIRNLGIASTPLGIWLIASAINGGPLLPTLPTVDPIILVAVIFFTLMIFMLIGSSIMAGRSPHVTYTPEQINITMADIKGADQVVDEVSRSLDLFLANKTFQETMGGRARRGLLFEGTPGTGKTMMAKAMAAEAGVPFYFVSATSFQSMYYGATARKIRSYFKAVRKAARAEGGAIAFIEEIDAVATARGGMNRMTPRSEMNLATIRNESVTSEGTGGVVNEFLVQMQSFDELTGSQKLVGKLVDTANLFLAPDRQLKRPVPEPVNVLVIAATNRADNLDPALLRPGRFDRRLVFELPEKASRRDIIDYYLDRKAHDPELDLDDYRDALASVTQGFSPARLENLLDEALVNAVRRGSTTMNWKDIEAARLLVEVGLGQPVTYTDHEKQLIATHEAGHAVAAYLEAPQRRLEILTIIKRGGALGMLAHGDAEDVYTRSHSELTALIRIAFGGFVAEEIYFGETSTGPSGDLAYATNTAVQMVGAAGMKGSMISYASVEEGLGGGNLNSKVLGSARGYEAVSEVLDTELANVRNLLKENRHLVEALRDALLDRHELVGSEILAILHHAEQVHGSGRSVASLAAAQTDAQVPPSFEHSTLQSEAVHGSLSDCAAPVAPESDPVDEAPTAVIDLRQKASSSELLDEVAQLEERVQQEQLPNIPPQHGNSGLMSQNSESTD